MTKINHTEIEKAYERIKKYINSTPLITNNNINKKYGSKIFFKLENKQKTGSFKIRGALNKILQLNKKERKKGIVAYSSGNHAQAVSYVSKLVGINSTIVMPRDAPKIKIMNTKKYGSKIILYDRRNESREEIAKKLAKKNGYILVPPFDDEDIIIGQGTIGLEIARKLKNKNISPDVFLCCCSGGGLIAGSSTYLKESFSNLKIYCVEPKYYDDMRISLEKGKLTKINIIKNTICDALTCQKAGRKTFAINKRLLECGLTVSDYNVKNAIRFLKKNLNTIVEPGGAVPTAAFLSKYSIFYNKVVVIMISGGNIDKEIFNKIMKND